MISIIEKSYRNKEIEIRIKNLSYFVLKLNQV
mgnify:CR=1 FL=1